MRLLVILLLIVLSITGCSVKASEQIEVPTWLDGSPRGYVELAKAISDNPDILMHVCHFIENGAPYDINVNPADRFSLLKEFFNESRFDAYISDMNNWFDVSHELVGDGDEMVIEVDNNFYTYSEYVNLFGIPSRDLLPHGLYPDEIANGEIYTLDCSYDFYYIDDENVLFIQMYYKGKHMFDVELSTDGITDLFGDMKATRIYE